MAEYVIGVRGCQHLGTATNGMRNNKQTRWNQRIVDTHVAHRLTMESMIEHGVAGLVDGGDLTHFNKPHPRDVAAANAVDDLRAMAGIWGIGNSGNHCAGGGSDISAMGVMHRPALGMLAVYPDPNRSAGVGPFPGLYEVHTSETVPGLPEGIALHLVSHFGLSKYLADAGIVVDPQPLPGMVNLLFSHGTFESDERLYACINPHGEERPIPREWVERGWDATILSHYHNLGPIPGFGDGDRGQVWYTGSSLRRGFSDEAGGRGWVKVSIADTGHVRVEPVLIWQRPQVDLPAIDATGLTVADLDDLVTSHLSEVDMHDPATEALTGDGGAIVRQLVTGATPAQRRGLSDLRGRYLNLTGDAAHWTGLVYERSNNPKLTPAPGAEGGRDMSSRVTDFTADLSARFERLAHKVGVPDELLVPVKATASGWTDELSTDDSLGDTASA